MRRSPIAEARAALVSYLTHDARSRGGWRSRIPGRPLVHRLNRAEYANAIRDLLALDVDASALLPPDDAAYGFDNIADALGVSPVLLERYLAAAGKISSLAVGDPDTRTGGRDVPHPPGRVAGHRTSKGCRSAPSAASSRRRRCRSTASTTSRSSCSARTSASCAASSTSISSNTRSTASACTCRSVGGDDDFRANLKNMTKAGDDVEARAHVRMPLKAGPHAITAAFLERTRRGEPAAAAAVHPQLERHARHDRASAPRHVHADGPVQPDRAGRHAEPPARSSSAGPRRPRPTKTRARAASSSTLARRAYRGLATAADLDRLLEFYRARPASGGTLRDGHPDGAAAHARQPEVRRSASSAIRRAWRRARSIASATSSWRRGCRSSCGAAFPTIELLRVARPGHAAHAGGAEPAGAAHAGRSEGRGARRQLRRAVAVPAEPEEPAAELERVPGLRRQPAAGASSARPSCSSRASCARTATSST